MLPQELGAPEPIQRLRKQVEQFLAVYRFMGAEEKARFEAELQVHLKNFDERTQKLYQGLVASAREGRGVAETIQTLENVDGRRVYVEKSAKPEGREDSSRLSKISSTRSKSSREK